MSRREGALAVLFAFSMGVSTAIMLDAGVSLIAALFPQVLVAVEFVVILVVARK